MFRTKLAQDRGRPTRALPVAALDAEPLKATGQALGGVVDLQDTSVARSNGGFRCMQDRRGIEPDVSGGGQTGSRATPSYNGRYIRFGNAAKTMRPRRDEQRRIGGGNIVEVETQSDHARQQLEWRGNMKRPPLPRPRPETFDIYSSRNGNHAILVPSENPIGIGSLVKEDGPYRTGCFAENSGCQGTYWPAMAQKWVQARNAKESGPRAAQPLSRKRLDNLLQSHEIYGGAM